MDASIVLGPDTDDEGLPGMLAQMLRQNLADHPRKRQTFQRMLGRVALVLTDADADVTLDFQGGHLVVHRGVYGIPDVTIRTTSDWIMKMSLMELGSLGLPQLRGQVVREVIGAMRGGEIEGHRTLSNTPLLLRLTRIMSVHAP